MAKDKRANNGGKGGRKKMFEEGTARIMVSVPKPEKEQYSKEINIFIHKKYKKDHKK